MPFFKKTIDSYFLLKRFTINFWHTQQYETVFVIIEELSNYFKYKI